MYRYVHRNFSQNILTVYGLFFHLFLTQWKKSQMFARNLPAVWIIKCMNIRNNGFSLSFGLKQSFIRIKNLNDNSWTAVKKTLSMSSKSNKKCSIPFLHVYCFNKNNVILPFYSVGLISDSMYVGSLVL